MNRRFPALSTLCLLGFFALNSSCPPLSAEDPRFPNTEDLRHIKAIGNAQLSPDGKTALFSMTDATADGAKSHFWLIAVDGGAARQITYSPTADKRGEHGATWAPDGSAIYFLAHRGENTQLFRLPMSGGEAAPYDLKVVPAVDDSKEKDAVPPAKTESPETKPSETKPDAKKDPIPPDIRAPASNAPTPAKADDKPEPLDIDVSGYAISPDGKWLAVWAEDPETPGEKKAKEAKADAVWVNHEHHGTRLYLATLKADGTVDGALKPVALSPDVHVVSWSPKSDRLIAVIEKPNDAGDLGPAGQALLVFTSDLDKPVALSGIPATVGGGLAWNQDGAQILFEAQTPDDAPPGVSELFSLALPEKGASASTEPRRLMSGFEGQLVGQPVFLANGKVLAPVGKGTRVTAAWLTPDGSSAPELISQATPVVIGLNTNLKQTGWLWFASGSDHPESLCYSAAPPAASPAECRTLPTPELTTQHFRAVKSQLITWQSDGLTIEGLLYLPPEAATKKVPLIVDVHGGPTGSWADSYEEWNGFLVGHGWAILRPNPRGSSSYGVKFAAANKNDLGGGDFRDVMTGVDAVIKSYSVDPAKLALMGYSYGGEMAGFAEGKTDRFKAIISGAPVIDQFSEYGTERDSWYDRWFYGKPWEHFEDAWRQSPLSGVSKAKTPFLLIQGESDGTDPLGQSQEMYRALRQAGVPVEMVSYPREDHGPLARGIFGYPSAEPWHGFDGRQHIVQFLEKGFGQSK